MAGSVFAIEGGKRYRGVLTLKDEFGIPFRKEFSGTDRKSVKRRMNAWADQYQAGKPTDAMPTRKVCELAIEACQRRGCSPKTIEGYRQLLRTHVEPNIGAVKITELQAAHVERMMEKMGAAGASSQTRALARNFLRMAINRVAMKGGYVTLNVAALADPPRVKHKLRKAITPEELAKVLDAEDRPVLRALWLFLASTGLRPGEARDLLWSDFYEGEDGWWVRLRESKTEEGKLPVPVSGVVMLELHRIPKTGLYTFCTPSGKPYDESNLRREWVAALKKADVPFTNLYQLRKLFGTLKARRVNDSVLKRLMRHRDARTTKQYYVTALEQDLRAAVED